MPDVECSFCHSTLYKKASTVTINNFCSRFCFNEWKKTPRVRFWRYVEVKDENDCWLWIGSKGRDGYGRCGPNLEAHRESYVLNKGPIPAGLLVRHTCHNPPCVNPAHLILGTTRDNSEDMVKAGRSLRGELGPQAKLMASQVKAIRELSRTGYSNRILSKAFEVCESNISQIIKGSSWRHLDQTKHY